MREREEARAKSWRRRERGQEQASRAGACAGKRRRRTLARRQPCAPKPTRVEEMDRDEKQAVRRQRPRQGPHDLLAACNAKRTETSGIRTKREHNNGDTFCPVKTNSVAWS
eukprot:2118234-Pleurochrysis_carterae.AAC.2